MFKISCKPLEVKYDNYLPELCNDTNLTIPEKEIYLKNKSQLSQVPAANKNEVNIIPYEWSDEKQ